jgi:ubiquinol-cytochrome c reductase iron-sulfur subunit
LSSDHNDEGRRDFLMVAAGSFAAVGAVGAVWPLVDQMNPDASAKALASIEVDLSPIKEGQAVTVMWRGKPVFIRKRTADEIKQAVEADGIDMRDPQADGERAQKPEWLVLIGICTHLGCIPRGQSTGDVQGEYGGWFCPCHGSHYDTSGRIRKGPAPTNLEVPPYAFITDTKIKIG